MVKNKITGIVQKIKNSLLTNPHINPYFSEQQKLHEDILSLISKDSIWIYSLMKSGTTYTALFLSNYINYCFGDKSAVSFDQMNKEFCLHSLEHTIRKVDIANLFSQNKLLSKQIPNSEGIFTTHVPIYGDMWSRNISLYRNPLDYIISSYFFHYRNRGVRCEHPRKIIDNKIREFSLLVNTQKKLEKQYPEKVIRINYENLIREPEDTFKWMVNFLGFDVDEQAIAFALENSSKKKVKEMEKERGKALIAGKNPKFEGSFIRSGKIGEWKEYFNEKDLKRVEKDLSKYDLDLNEFVLD